MSEQVNSEIFKRFSSPHKRVFQIDQKKLEDITADATVDVFDSLDVSQYSYIFASCIVTDGHENWAIVVRHYATPYVSGGLSSLVTEYTSQPPLLLAIGSRRAVGEYTEVGAEKVKIGFHNQGADTIPQADVYIYGVR